MARRNADPESKNTQPNSKSNRELITDDTIGRLAERISRPASVRTSVLITTHRETNPLRYSSEYSRNATAIIDKTPIATRTMAIRPPMKGMPMIETGNWPRTGRLIEYTGRKIPNIMKMAPINREINR